MLQVHQNHSLGKVLQKAGEMNRKTYSTGQFFKPLCPHGTGKEKTTAIPPLLYSLAVNLGAEGSLPPFPAVPGTGTGEGQPCGGGRGSRKRSLEKSLFQAEVLLHGLTLHHS